MTDFTADEIREGNRRLEKCAQATEEHPKPDMFTMGAAIHKCGTPGCAMGSYAARPDLQGAFEIQSDGSGMWIYESGGGPINFVNFSAIRRHFALDEREAMALFDVCGCDSAQTPEDAAAFIRAFVSRRASRVGAGE